MTEDSGNFKPTRPRTRIAPVLLGPVSDALGWAQHLRRHLSRLNLAMAVRMAKSKMASIPEAFASVRLSRRSAKSTSAARSGLLCPGSSQFSGSFASPAPEQLTSGAQAIRFPSCMALPHTVVTDAGEASRACACAGPAPPFLPRKARADGGRASAANV